MDVKFDFNLVRIFCALYETGSLTKTAELLQISQPAISHSLKKLRNLYNDQLFIRTEGRMLPTTLSENISNNLLNSKELILSTLPGINSEIVKKNFIFSMSDMCQSYFVPSICLLMEENNNKVNIDVIQTQQSYLVHAMRDGEIDFSIGHLPVLKNCKDNIICEKLFDDKFVLMIREEHPYCNEEIDVIFENIELVGVKSLTTGHTDLIKNINNDFENKVILNIPNYSVAPEIVSKTDYGVIIPKYFSKRFNYDNQFIIIDINTPQNIIDINLYYHKLFKNDYSIKWMREIILNNFKVNTL
ncbi:LysR family transcriptional regulator [Acinetobacter schindleri]|uniref:LysR family transcriptional regulator n=1 Tax=Acinetobacter schindleri TaxID=108981 RepID=UPI0013B08B6D|nr:LysR family transcriptional regulator [Acinetobacter schindleri]QIC62237.1 LysR family transcriptional regulator [Acinetobacter schindleri]